MLSHNDFSGLWAYVVGLIILVMGGVTLSLVVDRRLNVSVSKGGLQSEIADGSVDLGYLRETLAARSHQWWTEGVAATRAAEELAATKTKLPDLARRQSALVGELAELEQAVAGLEAEFSKYRSDYRRQAWQDAAGETLEELTLVDGRRYEEAVIAKVTAVGLEIRHAHGTARIEAPLLSSELHERFQWDDEERRAKLRAERLHRERMNAAPFR